MGSAPRVGGRLGGPGTRRGIPAVTRITSNDLANQEFWPSGHYWCCDGPGIDGCGAHWTGSAKVHCGTCHRTFSTQGSADRAHRYPASGIVCLDPERRGMHQGDDGVWRRDAPGVPILADALGDSGVSGLVATPDSGLE